MDKIDVIHAIKCGLFAKRNTIDEAMQVFHRYAQGLSPDDRLLIITGLHVVLNTVAYQLEINEQIDSEKEFAA